MLPQLEIQEPIKPFLRWIGGKSRLVKTLSNFVPDDLAQTKYWEPFLGAGNLFFFIQPANAILPDQNNELMHCYQAISENPELVAKHLSNFLQNHNKDYYYLVRNEYNKMETLIPCFYI